jgi:hypothetical protein
MTKDLWCQKFAFTLTKGVFAGAENALITSHPKLREPWKYPTQ